MITITIIEENAALAQHLSTQLNTYEGIHVIETFASPHYLFSYLERSKKCPDIILMNSELSNIHTIMDIEKIKKHCKNSQIILLLSDFSPKNILLAIKAGIAGYILKSEPTLSIYEAIIKVNEGCCYISEHLAKKIIEIVREYILLSTENIDFKQLSPRENEITQLIAQGISTRQISEQLFISYGTVRTHIRSIFEKLQIKSKSELIVLCKKYF